MSHLDRITDWVEKAKAAHYDGQTLAALCRVSVSHLRRYCVTNFDRSLQAWLNEIRLWHAAWQLANGTKVISVAHDLFFADAAHLCHCFKAYFGCAPLEFELLDPRKGVTH